MGMLYACSATERGIQERRQRAPVCEPAPEVVTRRVVAFRPSKVERLVIPRTDMQELIASIAQKHGLTAADIIGRSRRYKVVRARREAVRAVREARPSLSLVQVGRLFRRDFSTIRHFLITDGR
jgi:hypothetical protein